MAFRNGPQYPYISEGLVFLMDPPNPISWPGGTNLYNIINTSYSASAENFDAGTEWDNARSLGGYINLDGSNDYFEGPQGTGYGGNLNGLTSFTLQAWCRAESDGGTDNIVGNWISDPNRSWQLRRSGTTLQGFITTDGGYTGAGDGSTDSSIQWDKTSAFSINTWYCVTFYLDGTTSPAGVGGNISSTSFGAFEKYTWNYSGTMSPKDLDKFAIGSGNSDGASNVWAGDLGTICIYNRALSEAEMERNYNQLKGRYGL